MIARLMGLDTISPRDFHRLLQEGRDWAIDVNSPQSWAQARVPGAVNLDPAAYDAGDLPADKGALLVSPVCYDEIAAHGQSGYECDRTDW